MTDPPATRRDRMIADLANFVPAGTNVEAVADKLLYEDFASMHEVMQMGLDASELLELFPVHIAPHIMQECRRDHVDDRPG